MRASFWRCLRFLFFFWAPGAAEGAGREEGAAGREGAEAEAVALVVAFAFAEDEAGFFQVPFLALLTLERLARGGVAASRFLLALLALVVAALGGAGAGDSPPSTTLTYSGSKRLAKGACSFSTPSPESSSWSRWNKDASVSLLADLKMRSATCSSISLRVYPRARARRLGGSGRDASSSPKQQLVLVRCLPLDAF